MAATTPASFRRRLGISAPFLLLPVLLAGTGGWFHHPRAGTGSPQIPVPRPDTRPADDPPPTWPDARLEGEPARRLLLAFLTDAADRLDRVDGYTATFQKRERIDGVLGPEQTMELKLRHRPFAVYLKYHTHRPGREVIYAEGKNDNKLVAHNGDWTRHLIPRMVLSPTDPLALAHNRHPVTEAGLAHLTRGLLDSCRADLDDPDAVTVLDRVTEGGRAWLRSTQTFSRRTPDRPFARVEVGYDPETRLPMTFDGYDWPEPGQAGGPALGESYRFEDLKLDARLSDADFDPENPSYAFARF